MPMAPWLSTNDAGDNGDELIGIASDSWVAARFGSADTGPGAVVVSFDDTVVVSGFLPWDYQGSDLDGEGAPDVSEFYINQFALVTGCTLGL